MMSDGTSPKSRTPSGEFWSSLSTRTQLFYTFLGMLVVGGGLLAYVVRLPTEQKMTGAIALYAAPKEQLIRLEERVVALERREIERRTSLDKRLERLEQSLEKRLERIETKIEDLAYSSSGNDPPRRSKRKRRP